MENLAETEGIIIKIKRFSIHDGPGIRTTVFIKGCPLNCIWCHSPEGISSDISIWYDKKICIGCGKCVDSCPDQALTLSSGSEPGIIISRNLCNTSGNCVSVCPTEAIQFTGYKTNIADLLNEIEKDMLYYSQSGGGITLSGGEPLYQPGFSAAILKECHKRNIHTAIETSLFCEREIITDILDCVDLFIIDLKLYDERQHIRYTTRTNVIIKDNIRLIAESGKDILIRIPMVENITDTDENKNSIRSFINSIDESIPIEYLSYNPLAENNYKKLDIPFLLK